MPALTPHRPADDFAPEDEEPTSERVINVVSKFNLQPGPELKNSKALVEAIGPVIARLRKHIKVRAARAAHPRACRRRLIMHCASLCVAQATNPDRLDAFKAQGARFVKEFLVPNAKELEVYRPDGAFEPEDMLVFCKWGDDGESLKFYYFKDSLKSIRC